MGKNLIILAENLLSIGPVYGSYDVDIKVSASYTNDPGSIPGI